MFDANRRWEWRRAIDAGKTRSEWLASISIADYEELKALSRLEPVGSDALIFQLALILCSNTKLTPDKASVFCTFQKMSAEYMQKMMSGIPKVK